jgi:2-methylcitrate dehydratase PrpD
MRDSLKAKGYTRQVAEFVVEARLEDAPQDVIERVKLHLLDAVGIMLGAYAVRHPILQGVIQLARESGGNAEATLVGAGDKVACADAAMANAVLANFLDFSDGHFLGGHINDRLVPICLAVGERVAASGREVLEALLVGYEVYIHLATQIFNTAESAPVRIPCFTVVGTIAGAAVAGRLLKLSAREVAAAMGLAASFQLATAQYVLSGGHEKDLCPGHEARRAVISALLVQKGVMGSDDILEGERGLLHLFGSALPTMESIKLGETWRIAECYIKPYPACRYLHASIEAALQLRGQGIEPEQIERVTVTTNSSSAARTCYRIQSHVNAIFSHPYQVAVSLVEGKVEFPTAWATKLQDPRISSLLYRIQVQTSQAYEGMYHRRSLDLPPWPAEIEVVLHNGRRISARVLSPRGDPGNPLTKNEIIGKYLALGGMVLGQDRLAQVKQTIDILETIPCVTTLTELLIAS